MKGKRPVTAVKLPSMTGRATGGANRFAPGAKPKQVKRTVWRIIKIYARWGKTIFAALGLTALSSFFSVSIPYFIGYTFNTFHTSTLTVDTRILGQLLLIIAGLYLANWLVVTINGVLLLRVSQKLVFVLRSEFFATMQKLPLMFYDTTSHGDTMSRLTNDVDNISSTLAQMTTQIVASVLTLIGSLVVMICLNIPLTLTVLLCVPLVLLLTKLITQKSKLYFLAQQCDLGELNGIVEEHILGLKMVKAFGRQQDVLKKFDGINEQLCENSKNAQIWAGFMMPLMNVINNLTFTLVAIAGGMLSIDHGLAIGTVVSFLSYSKHFGQPLNAIAGMFNTIQSALAGAERVFEILDQPIETPDLAEAVELRDIKGDVRFQDVSFSYRADRQILHQISFAVQAGDIVALVGETGAGKTTIVNLLTRFYDAESGAIFIDGIDIKRVKRDSLRKCFSVVLQDTWLFTGTIMENIRYSKPEATDEQIIQAAKIAHAHPFIEKLPKGYATVISGSVDSLSQGQRQLLAIARAVLGDNPILILDEATSSVDTKTEKEIQQALLTLMQSRTSFLIAHRLSTIREADKIMVIGDGKIIEQGNHNSLMQQKGRYYQMVVSQMGVIAESNQ